MINVFYKPSDSISSYMEIFPPMKGYGFFKFDEEGEKQ
jgi:hypothetical protein